MIKKTITYTDYEGVERTEDFHFNLTKAELMEMEMSTDGGLEKTLKRIVDAKDSAQIIAMFKKILLQSYGEKSPDGRRFVKSQELRDAFCQTEAYSIIFMELATDSEAASAFINGIVPHDK